MTDPETNPVGFLQEFVQKYNVSLFPEYIECGVVGQPHARKFTCRCEYHGFEAVAIAASKKQAKHESAKKMVELLKSKGYFDKYCKVGNNSTISGTIQSKEDMILNIPEHQSEMPSSIPTEALGPYQLSYIPNTVKKNPISLLQECCQQKFGKLPNYSETASLGGEFLVKCELNDKKTFGTGASKKSAKTEAAAKMCFLLKFLQQSTEQNDFIMSEEVEVDSSVSSNTSQIKHPVSQLQELCVHNGFPLPVYEDKPGSAGTCLFIVICNVGNITGNGSHSTKKGAKTLAAANVLKQLQLKIKDRAPSGRTPGAVVSLQEPKLKHEVLELDELNDKFARSSLHTTPVVLEEFKVKQVLEEFPLDDDNDESVKDLQNNTVYLQSLTFNDSVVDIDPGSGNVCKLETDKLEADDLKVKSESPVIFNHSS